MRDGEEKRGTGMFVGICESIKGSRHVFYETHQINYAPMTTTHANKVNSVVPWIKQNYGSQIKEPQVTPE